MKTLFNMFLILVISIQVQAQERKIVGTVTDESGLPLPGASIMIKGTNKGTQTDFDGLYEIKAKDTDVLLFSFVGYVTEERKVGKLYTILVTLKADVSKLEEVVVVGYGIKNRRSLTNSVATLTASQLKRQKRKAYHNQLAYQIQSVPVQGGLTGVQIVNSNTNLNKTPLYIVDGIPIKKEHNHIIENLPINDIDSEVKYDNAEAKKKFGKIAKGGCIVITTHQGNYRIENSESYAAIIENAFERTLLAPLSTFSIDVDKASYSNIRRMINNGMTIDPDAVKIEEMINYFNYNYSQPTGEHPFSITTEVVKTPWHNKTKLVRIGLQGKTFLNEELPASNLTFLIDVSGSMADQNKLPLLKQAFKLLVNQLREKDKVSIVVYAGAAGVVLEPTSGKYKEKIVETLDHLQSGGSTAGGAGIELAYKLAEKNFNKNGNNRVILATDGDFNVGTSSDKAMERLIEEKRKSGVFLSVLGFGYGNYKDSKLEILADKGNGNHAYIDNMQEAQKVFGKEFGGTLFTIAKDVKIQIEFNPNKVQAYRLIGYENRLLNDEDFIDDTKDAGELGSGHTVTALYEVIPVGVKSDYLKDVSDLKYTKSQIDSNFSNELFTVKFRYKKPSEDKSIEMFHIQKDEITLSHSDLNFASAVALFGMQLRQSKYCNDTTIDDVIALANMGRGKDKDGYRAEFIRLVQSYQNL
ncbi:VWA domain-containing protein [Aestuariivivens sp. NBU2969]|uniref:vWA domain-containing protein n=1 Tax=Aestuariivivens sp. NBU2969 TaxID=2873267 RepID=UPI001CBCC476|nr:VWA domain-containing protein [Aestuariivivens sp. NBU2969]